MREAFSFVRTLCLLLLAAIAIRGIIIEPFKIPSGSMRPTLEIGDHILVTKFDYGFWLPFMKETLHQFGAPKRGDIVVFTRPDWEVTTEDESDLNIIKRVIGLPGDTVEVEATRVYINSELLNEPYAVWAEGGTRDFGPEKVPDGHVLLLGDNRDHSKDSRFWEDGPYLPIRRIKGKARIVYWNLRMLRERFGKIVR